MRRWPTPPRSPESTSTSRSPPETTRHRWATGGAARPGPGVGGHHPRLVPGRGAGARRGAPDLDHPTAAQLWPEHFDIGLSATTPTGGVNLGASPGDAGVAEPYLYVAPWTGHRPGDPDFWNAPYGAVVTRSVLAASDDPGPAAVAFLTRGVDLLSAG